MDIGQVWTEEDHKHWHGVHGEETCPLCHAEQPYRPLAVTEADTLRNCMADNLEFFAPQIAEEAAQAHATDIPLKVNSLLPAAFASIIRRATLVFWRLDLWMAAIAGCETFKDTKFDISKVIPPAQFLLPDRDFFYDEEGCELLKLPRDVNVATAMLLFSGRGVGMPSLYKDGRDALVAMQIVEPAPKWAAQNRWDVAKSLDREDLWPRIRFGIMAEGATVADDSFARVVALQEFMKLPIVNIEHCRPERAERRRLERAGKKVPEVKVITLRRVQQAKHEDGSPVNWSCCWAVSGHWRNQWYPSLQEHKPSYVHAYVKGDLSKPMKQPVKSVYEVRR